MTDRRRTDIRLVTESFMALRAEAERLPPGGGDGTFGGMEERVSRLETHVDALHKDVVDIKVDVAVIKATMATKSFIVVALSTAVGLATAILAFGEKLIALLAG